MTAMTSTFEKPWWMVFLGWLEENRLDVDVELPVKT
jgi:hypothetical protein